MGYKLRTGKKIQSELRKVAREQIDRAIDEIDDPALSRDKSVHQARKRCKKLRALLRLYRPALGKAYDKGNTWFRDTARIISDTRDAAAFIETYDALCDHYDDQIDRRAFASIRAGLTRRLDAIKADEEGLNAHLAEVRQRLVEGRKMVDGWSVDAKGFDAVAGGLKKTYRRGRDAMEEAYDAPAPERFHEWRKRAKYYRYQLKLLRPAWPEVINAHRKQMNELTDVLGDAHDLAALEAHLLNEPDGLGAGDDIDALVALARQRRLELETAAKPLGDKLYHDKPKRLVKRIGAWRSSEARPPKPKLHLVPAA